MLSRREWFWLGIGLLTGNLLFAWGAAGESRREHGQVIKERPDRSLPDRLFAAQPERVVDGDTVVFLQGVCRLIGIDAPELAQPAGPEAKGALVALLPPGSQVLVMVWGRDKYGRMLCAIYASDGYPVAMTLVESGWAWVYLAEGTPFWVGLKAAEARARGERRGVWGSATPEPPWEYRKRVRSR